MILNRSRWVMLLLSLVAITLPTLPALGSWGQVAPQSLSDLSLLPGWFQPDVSPFPDETRTAELNRSRERPPNQVAAIPGFACYRTVEETYATATAIVTTHPTLASWIDVGDSWEKTQNPDNGYDLMVLRLTNAEVSGPKPKLFVMSSVHAREYPPAELNTRFAEYLVDHYDVDPDVTWLLDYHEIHLLLQANPDGRKLAEAGYLQRKNTNDSNGGGCTEPPGEVNQYGTDLNRNFAFYWNWSGCSGCSSGDPCDPLYHGPSAASEPETQAIQDYLRAQFPDLRSTPLMAPAPITATGLFIDLHNKAKEVLWPWGFTNTVAPNGTALQTLGRKLAYFNHYVPEQSIDLYPADGTTHDFAYGDLGLAAYTIELGETDFFQDCDTFEDTILPDNLPSLLYAAKAARAPYQLPSGPDALSVTVALTKTAAGLPVTLTAIISDARFNHSNGAEPAQNISAAEYYIDVPPWVTATTPISYPMVAADGAFDETEEAVEAVIDTSGLAEDRHTLFVRGRDADGNWGAVSAVFLHVALRPTAQFTTPLPVMVNQPITFANLTTGTLPITYAWDFGDGIGASADSAPTHTYTATGLFTVTLVATNYWGSDSVSQPLTVLPPPCPPVTITQLVANGPVILGESIFVTPTVVGQPPLTYTWNWGDDTSPIHRSAGLPVTHTYSAAGLYTVTLEIVNHCVASDTQTVSVTVDPHPQPAWTTRVTVNGVLTDALSIQVAHGDTVQVIDWVAVTATRNVTYSLLALWNDSLTMTSWLSETGHGSAAPNSARWDVIDGAPNTWHALTKTFQVVSDTWSYEFLTETLEVWRAEVQPDPRVLIFDNQATCSSPLILDLHSDDPVMMGTPTYFAATLVGDSPLTSTWDFGDGLPAYSGVGLDNISHTFSHSGTYTVSLTATNACPPDAVQSLVVQVSPYRVYLPLVIK